MPKRDTYKYHFKDGNEILHCGITNDLDRREKEHKRDFHKPNGHIVQVGNITTREAAFDWEEEWKCNRGW